MRTILYSLRTINDKSVLSIDLTGLVISETHYTLQIKLDSGLIFLEKFDYLNKMKIYDDGSVFFIVCTKSVSRDSAFTCLMNHAISKLDKRVDTLLSFKNKLQKELVAA